MNIDSRMRRLVLPSTSLPNNRLLKAALLSVGVLSASLAPAHAYHDDLGYDPVNSSYGSVATGSIARNCNPTPIRGQYPAGTPIYGVYPGGYVAPGVTPPRGAYYDARTGGTFVNPNQTQVINVGGNCNNGFPNQGGYYQVGQGGYYQGGYNQGGFGQSGTGNGGTTVFNNGGTTAFPGQNGVGYGGANSYGGNAFGYNGNSFGYTNGAANPYVGVNPWNGHVSNSYNGYNYAQPQQRTITRYRGGWMQNR